MYARHADPGFGARSGAKRRPRPRRAQTIWEGGMYTMEMIFSDEYPSTPPKCKFSPALFHPNIFKSGTVCLSIITVGGGWSACLTIKHVLIGIQALLDEPNTDEPAEPRASSMYLNDRSEYERVVRAHAASTSP